MNEATIISGLSDSLPQRRESDERDTGFKAIKMTQHTFTLTISKVHEQLFHDEALSVTVPGSEGEMTILAHHEPLITILKSGTIIVRTAEIVKQFTIKKGLLETSNGQVTIMV